MTDDPDDDRHWLVGTIYFNPKDPRILVPKRLGSRLGRTLNLARPTSWAVLVLILVVVFLVARH
ncbi:DUF5808 domain-containing protein [Nocardioides terrisoli]|uniref:DUF5808 domain-containing protein n=1 Tax=Nocardioides terrisoli TaxID=3388267 RepID=UPI00287B81D1|nr:DUF5808 domain-containing protein [Nocardioides marmorisolisilvae]